MSLLPVWDFSSSSQASGVVTAFSSVCSCCVDVCHRITKLKTEKKIQLMYHKMNGFWDKTCDLLNQQTNDNHCALKLSKADQDDKMVCVLEKHLNF